MNKKQLGQYFTKKDIWLKPQIKEFIISTQCNVAYDPFAGNGDMLSAIKECGIKKTKGLDIDKSLEWEINDSLRNVPHEENAIIITNPPYLTKYSASRKNILNGLEEYFKSHTDLYQLALDKMLFSQDFVVAIVPETYLQSSFLKKHLGRLKIVTILTENPFDDTETPVCVVCFDNVIKEPPLIDIYINSEKIGAYSYFDDLRLKPKKNMTINFNDKNGIIGLRAVDMPDPDKSICFLNVNDLNYDVKKIGNSSRLITIINLENVKFNTNTIIDECNNILNQYRENTKDILLSPFKGNNKEGKRRRRLDYKTARSIIETAIQNLEEDLEKHA